MNTPICDFVKKYADSDNLRLHMPGHKGIDTLGFERLDITEIGGADVLYAPSGIIAESEENAKKLFGSGKTVYSAEGSSLSIRAMIYLASVWASGVGKGRTILAGRNAHRVFHSAVALLDISVEWIYGDSLIGCQIDANTLDAAIARSAEKPFAVYLTSPDYLGNTLDIASLSEVCHRHGVLCLVDNAHGAYLRFLEESRHPIDLGADMCADSAHKTLPCITGGGYLHISKNAPKILSRDADRAMALFASTSPSYLILQSLDMTNKYLSEGYAQRLGSFCKKIIALKEKLSANGYTLVGDEPLKLTLMPKSYGYTGEDLAELLLGEGIVAEFSDKDHTVLMFTPEIGEEDLQKTEKTLLSIKKKEPIGEIAPKPETAQRAMSIRDALLSLTKEVDISDSVGEIFADAPISCPPAIPVIVAGERVDEKMLRVLEYYGIQKIRVVRKF